MGLLLIVIPLREPVLSPHLRGKMHPLINLPMLETLFHSKDWILQRFSSPASYSMLYVRSFHDGTTWGPWRKIEFTG